MKKTLSTILVLAALLCPALASGAAAAETPEEASVPHYVLREIESPTCTENGISAYVNENTNEVLFTFETAATGHKASALKATCTDPVVCVTCGKVLEAAVGHTYTYQFDAVRDEDGSFVSYGTWKCDKCGDVIEASEGNAVYYYDLENELAAEEPESAAEEETPAEEPESAAEEETPAEEPEAAAEEEAPAEEPEAAAEEETPAGEPETAAEEEAPAGEPETAEGKIPQGRKWVVITVVLVVVIVAVGILLVLSLNRKRDD